MEINVNNIKERSLHSLYDVKSLEVIDVNTGTKLGYIKDIVIDIERRRVNSFIFSVNQKRMFGKEDDYELEWENVVKVGRDVILIDGEEFMAIINKNNI